VLVRRLADATVIEVHQLRPHVLMDAGELGSRNLSVNWLEVPAGASEELRSHEEAEQVYVVAGGAGSMTATGDTLKLEQGDLVLIPPATDHSVANDGTEVLVLVVPAFRRTSSTAAASPPRPSATTTTTTSSAPGR
jgi:mannose-6-phosphate isomerase-like protein (cupin superfamily)